MFVFKSFGSFASTLLLSVLMLSGCQQNYGEKQSLGTLLGAAGGALAGSQVGKGRGKLVAVALGTAIGGLMGNEVGQSLDRADRLAMQNAEKQALTTNFGDPISWRNSKTGSSGTVQTTREGRSASGRYCREYLHTISIAGKIQDAYGTACRQPDGSWEIVRK